MTCHDDFRRFFYPDPSAVYTFDEGRIMVGKLDDAQFAMAVAGS
jgi:hypothetical protein